MVDADSTTAPRWMGRWLAAAGVYNLVWGGATVLLPGLAFDLAGMPRPRYPELWQCVGMIVGVYGVGYLLAARDPFRHWPIVLVGLLGKVLGPIGFAWAVVEGAFPAAFGLMILANDLVWWPAFAIILYGAFRAHQAPPGADAAVPSPEDALRDAITNAGPSIAEMSRQRPVLVVLLRHFGCTFCREAVADLATRRVAIEAVGTQLVLVHQASEAEASAFLDGRGLGDVPRVADPDAVLYRSLGLRRGSFRELFGPRVWWRGLTALLVGRHGLGRPVGDGFRMPGAFLIVAGRVVHAYRHATAADRPDYVELAGACAVDGLEHAA